MPINGGGTMRIRPEQVERYGMLVWENGTAEAVRKEECLCLHCASMRPGSQEHCLVAQQFYEIRKTYGTAFVLSRCAVWKEKPGETYHRSEEHTSELQSLRHLVCRLLLEKKNDD